VPAEGIKPTPNFPRPLEAGPRKLLWLRSEAMAYLESLPRADEYTPAAKARQVQGQLARAKVGKGNGGKRK